MKNKFICINPSTNEVVCIGNRMECNKYVKQLESMDEDSVYMKECTDMNYVLYEGYELVYIRDVDLVMTTGEIQMMKESCREEQQSIKFITDELNKLLNSEMFSDESKSKVSMFLDTMDELKMEQYRYLNDNIMYNIDIDALRYAYMMERENKGEFVLFTE